MLNPEFTGQFRRDYKLALKRNCSPAAFQTVMAFLVAEQPLPRKYRDHVLANTRNYKEMRECHIEPDWLLIYKTYPETGVLKLIRTGSHSDLFE